MFKKLLELQKKAFAPFSNYKVACIIETDNGNYSGVNIEPDVLNLGICAERNAIFNAITNGATLVKKIYLLTDSKKSFGTPCGGCRQLLAQFSNSDTIVFIYNINGDKVEHKLFDLLPMMWSKKDLKNE
ncbi:cytidine deaminase [bacterium]|nr:cytidine deaminase [bacterium]MBR2652023.1 cytidine deaminase [bacterium]